MKRQAVVQLLMISILVLLLCACSPSSAAGTTQPSGKLQVVATYSILGDIVQNVGGDALDLEVLVEADGDAHTFEPSPADVVKLAEAELVFENGIEFEPWLDDLYESSESEAPRIVVTENIELLEFGEHHDEEGEQGEEEHHEEEEEHGEEEHAEEDEHDHGEFDPHVWQDVANVISMVEVVRDALIDADPTNADTYQANAEAYLTELNELDAWVREQVATVPEDHRKLVTNHDTFSYFARAYGFQVIGTAVGGSTEGSEPSAGELAALIAEIREVNVPTIFAENIANTDIMNQIAEEAGVKIGPPLYTDALGDPGSEGETYLKLMHYNVEAIVSALQ